MTVEITRINITLFYAILKKILCLVLLKKSNVRHVIIKYCVLNSGLTSYCL